MAPPEHEPDLEPRDAAELLDEGDVADVRVENPTFDVTPPALVDRYLTERGSLAPDEIREVAAGAAERAGWPRSRP
jgi:translation initiation factor 2B subunit (eIF-2B alpha/beta/delta family)